MIGEKTMTKVKNPVLRGFYPDPSICRIGKDFYLVNSSFAYFPGIPIFHSRDLAHWEQLGNVLNRPSQLPLEGDEISRGIFAPTLRFHEDTFYLITTNIDQGGNFVVKADTPQGPWSEPYYLGAQAQGIDPSLFFDEDGTCYYVGTRPNQNGVKQNGDWEIWIQELDLKQMKLVGKSRCIWKGFARHVIWPEGPHIYKKDGFYYLIYAEGGTGYEHSVMVARSKSLQKSFEGCPRNPVLTHRHLGKNYPVTCVGHGDLFDDENGAMVYSCAGLPDVPWRKQSGKRDFSGESGVGRRLAGYQSGKRPFGALSGGPFAGTPLCKRGSRRSIASFLGRKTGSPLTGCMPKI